MEEKDSEQEKIANMLRKQGLAASAMSAESMAKDIVGGRTPSQKYFDIEKGQEQQTADSPAQGLTEEQAVQVLQKFTDMFTKELEKLTERLSNVEKQLDKIQNNLNVPAGEILSAKSLAEQMQPPQEERQQTLPQAEETKEQALPPPGMPPLPPQEQPAQPQPMPPPPQEPAEQKPQPVVQPVSPEPPKEEKKEEKKPSHHPRSAPYDKEKYSVDKFFYSGGK